MKILANFSGYPFHGTIEELSCDLDTIPDHIDKVGEYSNGSQVPYFKVKFENGREVDYGPGKLSMAPLWRYIRVGIDTNTDGCVTVYYSRDNSNHILVSHETKP